MKSYELSRTEEKVFGAKSKLNGTKYDTETVMALFGLDTEEEMVEMVESNENLELWTETLEWWKEVA
jgi:hypothetical protein